MTPSPPNSSAPKPVKTTFGTGFVLSKRIKMPRSRVGRRVLGVSLIIGGVLSFLPLLGIWMLPLGLLMLSVDSHGIRRWRRRSEVAIGRRWKSRSAPAPA